MGPRWPVPAWTMALARGFKSGTFPNIEGNFAVQYESARQEQLVMLEAGVKAQPAPWLGLEAALFRSAYRDKQVYGAIADPVFGTLGRVLNVPRAHVFGLEASLVAKPTARLSLTANLAFLDTRIDRYIGIDDFGAPPRFCRCALYPHPTPPGEPCGGTGLCPAPPLGRDRAHGAAPQRRAAI